MRDLQVNGPLAGYGPRGVIESWGPGSVVTIDDEDLDAQLWAERFVAAGHASWRADPEDEDEDGEPLRPVERAERAAARRGRSTRGATET